MPIYTLGSTLSIRLVQSLIDDLKVLTGGSRKGNAEVVRDAVAAAAHAKNAVRVLPCGHLSTALTYGQSVTVPTPDEDAQ